MIQKLRLVNFRSRACCFATKGTPLAGRFSSVTATPNIGFDRPGKKHCAGILSHYQSHIFVCTGTSDWPSRWSSDELSLPSAAQQLSYFVTLERETTFKYGRDVKVTACDLKSVGANGYDLIVFPHAVRMVGVTEQTLSRSLDFLKDSTVSFPGLEIVPLLHQRFVFVCCHGARDARCGYCGTIVFEELVLKKQQNCISNMEISKCAHVGGHEFAANVLTFPSGDWFGNVSPKEVDALFAFLLQPQHPESSALSLLRRGKMGF